MEGKRVVKNRLKWLFAAVCSFALFFGSALTLESQKAIGVSAAAKTVTYTVTSTSAVSVSGDAPEFSSNSYSSTNASKEQLTAGNSMTLTLFGYDGYEITGLTMSMRSNTSKGAGSFTMTVGGDTISSIENSDFNAPAWHGGWSTSYVDITPTVTSTEVGLNQSIVITIAASTSSLYCQSFTLTYEGNGVSAATYYYSHWVNQGKLAGKSGASLANDIHDVMWNSTIKNRPSYDDARYNLQETDADPSNSDYILDFWTGQPILASWESKVWNREHVWPASLSNNAWERISKEDDRSEKYAGCDLHHIRPSIAKINISRGAGALGIVDKSQEYEAITVNGIATSCLEGNNSNGDSVFEPGDNRKGDVARIFFYLYVTYSTRIDIGGIETALTDFSGLDSNYTKYTADLTDIIVDGDGLINVGSDYSNPIEMLLAWNKLDPVDAFESQRNNVAHIKQKNRNPFIDFPDLADYIFDSGSFYDLQMDADQTILYGEEYVPSVRTMPASAIDNVTYTSSQSSVISISGGGKVFTVNETGITRITASVTISGISFSKTVIVHVVAEVTSITLSSTTYTIVEGKTYTPSAYCVPADAYNRRIIWSSSDSSIATVDAITGKIKGVSEGTCDIVATADANDQITATLSLTVTAPSDGMLDIEISDFPTATSAYDTYSWSSGEYSGSGYIYQNECIQMKSGGDSYINNSTAFTKGISKIIFYSSEISSKNNSSLILRVGTSSITSSSGGSAGGTISIPTFGGNAVWTNDTGDTFTHFYFCTSGDKACYLARIRIIFGEPAPTLESLAVDYSIVKRHYNAGETLDLQGIAVRAVYDDGSSESITGSCSFSPEHGATLNTGHTSVTVSYDNGGSIMTVGFPITVEGPRTLSFVTLTPSSGSISDGETIQLSLMATYNDGSTESVTSRASWSSESTSIATVSSTGLVTGVSTGETAIISSFSYQGGISQSDSCEITVTQYPLVLSQDTFTCTFADMDFTPSFTATYGGNDVTASCTVSPSLETLGRYSYYQTLGVHEFTVSYTSGLNTYERTISIRTTNVGATTSDLSYMAFELVDNASDLVAGNQYIIANSAELSDSSLILSTTQNKNNRGQTAYDDAGTNFQLLTLGGSSGAWTFYTGTAGYLYAASSDNNYLKTQASNDANGEWAIVIDGTSYAAAITAQGNNTRNILRHNSTNSVFSCYGSGQNDVFLHKIINHTGAQASAMKDYLDGMRTCEVTSEEAVKRLALEYNTLNSGVSPSAKSAFNSLMTTAQFVDGIDYAYGAYTTDTPSGSPISCLTKIRYIVARWNSAHQDDLIYLYTTDYYNGIDNGGSGSKEAPLNANVIALRNQKENSPLTTTLWIVLGSGSAGLLLILGAYVTSKKRHTA